MPHFVMIVRDTRFWLVGPFNEEAVASEWGHANAAGAAGDDRWHVIELAEPHAPPRLVAPFDCPPGEPEPDQSLAEDFTRWTRGEPTGGEGAP